MYIRIFKFVQVRPLHTHTLTHTYLCILRVCVFCFCVRMCVYIVYICRLCAYVVYKCYVYVYRCMCCMYACICVLYMCLRMYVFAYAR